ncbi:MAG: hypothetical protein HY718_10645 [Planctomycetes bacterium]|nr:hypothetical protein [Planctomycetota bacterium]
MAPPRPFVLLHHVLPDSEHWDLCLDQGRVLATWQLLQSPTTLASSPNARPVPARRIPDHRRLYLDYEGPVSGNRGHVVRIDRGTYTLLDQQPRRWTVHLNGSVLIGSYEIAAADDSDAWMVYRTQPA